MIREKAYFLPTKSEISEIQRNILFGGTPVSITFNTVSEQEYAGQSLTDRLSERGMNVREVCVSTGGYAIKGLSKDRDSKPATIEVDTTIEPPVAFYVEDDE